MNSHFKFLKHINFLSRFIWWTIYHGKMFDGLFIDGYLIEGLAVDYLDIVVRKYFIHYFAKFLHVNNNIVVIPLNIVIMTLTNSSIICIL